MKSSPVALHRKPLADLAAEPGGIPFAMNSGRAVFHPESLKSQTVLGNHKISPPLFTTKLYSNRMAQCLQEYSDREQGSSLQSVKDAGHMA